MGQLNCENSLLPIKGAFSATHKFFYRKTIDMFSQAFMMKLTRAFCVSSCLARGEACDVHNRQIGVTKDVGKKRQEWQTGNSSEATQPLKGEKNEAKRWQYKKRFRVVQHSFTRSSMFARFVAGTGNG
ncbi:MAG: hypothetical protein AAF310_05120 [Myxococcota bacterium]